MPFLSKAQARWGNSIVGQAALKGKLHEWNQSTNFGNLPEHVVQEKTKNSIMKKLKARR